MPESQNIEYKISWRDEYLKWVCGFANAKGGKIFIGIDDKGNVVGVKDYKKLMDDIPNKVVNHLGIVVDVNLHKKDGNRYLEIDVPASEVVSSFDGKYYYRSGSTKQELKGAALQRLLLKKIGKHWENLPQMDATMDDLNKDTIRAFVRKAVERDRIPANAAKEPPKSLLKRLGLTTSEGHLTRAAVLLFGKSPRQVSLTATFRIGRFGKASHDLLFQDIVETNLFEMPDKVMEILKGKYLIRPISYQGLERMEPLEYPESALREAILNAIIHKEYSAGTWIYLRVRDDRLTLWNPGPLPEELTIEQLKTDHSSHPRNEHIASVFFLAGYIENWGRGTNKIIEATLEAGLPEPLIEEDQDGIRVTFLKDIYTEEYLKGSGLDDREIRALLFVKQTGQITNTQYQELFQVSKRTATNDLQSLIEKQLLLKVGTTGKGTHYVLQRGNKGAKGAAKGQ